jgi:hypothetical protein
MDHRQLALVMGGFIQLLLSFRSFREACTEFERQGMEFNSPQAMEAVKKRKREDELAVAFTTVAVQGFQYNFRRFWVDARSNHWITRVMDGRLLQEEQFVTCFRMSRNSFASLHGILGTFQDQRPTYTLVEPYISKQDTRWRKAIPSAARVIAYLLFVMQGMTYFQISNSLGIGVMTVCKCVHECTYAINRHMFAAYIRLPTPAEARATMEKWRQQTSIPGIYGAIDGTHIAIKKPAEHGQDYFNRKSDYSLNVQGCTLYAP